MQLLYRLFICNIFYYIIIIKLFVIYFTVLNYYNIISSITINYSYNKYSEWHYYLDYR